MAERNRRARVRTSVPQPSQLQMSRRRPTHATRKPRWVRGDESVIVAGREIGGMVYVGRSRSRYGSPDNPFIDPTLPVAPTGGNVSGAAMPYWPNYSSIEPHSRATYLEWLAGGRADPNYGAGYVFLYFYGLERRFFIDRPDPRERRAIVAEVERLREAYGPVSNSVNNYLGSFLQAARIIMAEVGALHPVFERFGYEIPLAVRLTIGRMLRDAKPIPAEWMLSWLLTHPERPERRLRAAAQRVFPEFRELFVRRFRDRYPDGLEATAPRHVLAVKYRSASGGFEVNLSTGIPDISRFSEPLDKAVAIAAGAADDLDKFSRYLARNPDGRGSIKAHVLLPDPLHETLPCPELDKLREWARARIEGGGAAPVEELIARLEGRTPERIGKRQLTGAADALARLSIGLAPDPRFALRKPRLGEPVVLFALPDGITRLEEVSGEYSAALLALVMGTFIARADGAVSELERRHLSARFESSKLLTASEKARLQANLRWLTAVPPDLAPIRRRVREVGAAVRRRLGRVALAVVGADGAVAPAEIKAIRKLYRILGLDAEGVYRELHALAAATEPVTVFRPQRPETGYAIPAPPREPAADARAPVVLDQERVAAIMQDTTQVSSVLHAVFADTAEEDQETHTEREPEPGVRFAGLDARHRRLVEELLRQRSWAPPEFEKLARQFELMPAGVLETINEWAFERFDGALIEDNGTYEVNSELLDESAA